MTKNNIFQFKILLIDKPAGITSFSVVNKIKKIINIKKVGHSGTLDKFATGLLVIGIGRATKLTRFFLENDKSYTARVKLGITTDTYDTEGEITEEKDISLVTVSKVIDVVNNYKGNLSQVPPLYSALKVDGKRASDRVRAGEDIELKPRDIEVKQIEAVDFNLEKGEFTLNVFCSKGTYIRSLVRDIGNDLNVGGHLIDLRRNSSGIFKIENSITLENLEKFSNGEDISQNFMINPTLSLVGYNEIIVDNFVKEKVFNGRAFKLDEVARIEKNDKKTHIILDKEKNLIAIADIEIKKWIIKYLNVFN